MSYYRDNLSFNNLCLSSSEKCCGGVPPDCLIPIHSNQIHYLTGISAETTIPCDMTGRTRIRAWVRLTPRTSALLLGEPIKTKIFLNWSYGQRIRKRFLKNEWAKLARRQKTSQAKVFRRVPIRASSRTQRRAIAFRPSHLINDANAQSWPACAFSTLRGSLIARRR